MRLQVKKFGLLGMLLLSMSMHGVVQAKGFSEHNVEKKNWFIVQGEKIRDKIKSQIENSIEEAFEENIFKYLTDNLAGAFSDKLLSGLGGLFSIGPLISLDAVFNLGGSSDVKHLEVILEVLLEAIDRAKEEIIMSVEQQFRDETSARLNTIVRDLSIYNARSEEGRSADYRLLRDLISNANYVMERIQIKPGLSIYDDVKNYMNIAGVQILMQKEYTKWLYLNEIDPNAPSEDIDEETAQVLGAQLSYVNNYINSSDIGSLDFWRDEFANEFADALPSIQAVRTMFQGEVQSILGHAIAPDFHKLSAIYSYAMADGKVNFMVVGRELEIISTPGAMIEYRVQYDAYDASGEYVDTFGHWRIDFPESMAYPPSADVVRSRIGQAVIDRHINNNNAFHRYLLSGYLSLKDMLDEWWKATDRPVRPKSEVDIEAEVAFLEFSDVSLYQTIGEPDPLYDGALLVTIANHGGAAAENVILDILPGVVVDHVVRTDGLYLQCALQAFVYVCNLPVLASGEQVSLAVSFIDLQHTGMDFINAELEVWTSTDEILTGNNALSVDFPIQ